VDLDKLDDLDRDLLVLGKVAQFADDVIVCQTDTRCRVQRVLSQSVFVDEARATEWFGDGHEEVGSNFVLGRVGFEEDDAVVADPERTLLVFFLKRHV
jgi:hypothetical protein